MSFPMRSASWLNLVERWFALLTEKQIRRGSHRTTRALEATIREYLVMTMSRRNHLSGPKPLMKSRKASPQFVSESLTRD
jgi:hypothetical protein